MQEFDVVIIGAGPAGTNCAALLEAKNHKVLIIERSKFPRYCVGESFLPQNEVFLKRSNLQKVSHSGNYQFKDGAQFLKGDKWANIQFSDKFTEGPATTHQVTRDSYDYEITNSLSSQIWFQHEVQEIKENAHGYNIDATDLNSSHTKTVKTKFIVDASGLGMVLPNLLQLKINKNLTNRSSVFAQIKTEHPCNFDNNKILIIVHQDKPTHWFWLIPLKENLYSLGMIFDNKLKDNNGEEILSNAVSENPHFADVIGKYEFVFKPHTIRNYTTSCEVKYGKNFVLIGNAGEFIDPIFSSGVTTALKSSDLAAPLISKELNGEIVNWEEDYLKPLKYGVDTFRNFVESWYTQDLQDIIFSDIKKEDIRKMIVSILAGYAWDEKNPYTQKTQRRLKALAEICR